MQDMELKNKVLEEIIGMMDEKDGERLKSHPKLMAAKLEVSKPEPEEMMSEKPEIEVESEEELSPEMLAKLAKLLGE